MSMQSGVDWHMSQSINSICHRFAGKWKIGPSLRRDFSGIENEDGIAKKNSKPGVFAKGSRMKDVNWIANVTRGTTTTSLQSPHLPLQPEPQSSLGALVR